MVNLILIYLLERFNLRTIILVKDISGRRVSDLFRSYSDATVYKSSGSNAAACTAVTSSSNFTAKEMSNKRAKFS